VDAHHHIERLFATGHRSYAGTAALQDANHERSTVGLVIDDQHRGTA